jgi:hypothetical protein
MDRMIAHWMRLDIPYNQNATLMKGVLGFSMLRGGIISLETLAEEGCKGIPETIGILLAKASAEGITIGNPFTIVFPLDPRHDLAWIVKEEADKRGWNYARQVPSENAPPIDAFIPFVSRATGSKDDALPAEAARRSILHLNNEALLQYQSGMDLLDAIGNLRHALQLAWQHFGWASQEAAYTLRNLAFVYRGTGSLDNEREAIWLLHVAARDLEKQDVVAKAWDPRATPLLADLAFISSKLNDPALAARFAELARGATAR